MPDATQRRAGRPRKDVPPEKAAEVVRLWHRRKGSRRIASLTGLSDWQVRSVLSRKRLTHARAITQRWTSAQDKLLVEHVGEWGVKTLAKEASKVGPTRTPGAVRVHLSDLGLTGIEEDEGERHHVLPTLRMDLTLEQVAAVLGCDVETVRRMVRTRELRAAMKDGAYRVEPSVLRDFILANKRMVDWRRVEDVTVLLSIVGGELGTGAETKRKAAQRARKAERDEG